MCTVPHQSPIPPIPLSLVNVAVHPSAPPPGECGMHDASDPAKCDTTVFFSFCVFCVYMFLLSTTFSCEILKST